MVAVIRVFCVSVPSEEVSSESDWGAEAWLEAMEHRFCTCGLATARILDDLSGHPFVYASAGHYLRHETQMPPYAEGWGFSASSES